MKARVQVTEKLFRMIKIMISGGATVQDIVDSYNVSASTVARIRKSDTYENYKRDMNEVALRYRKPVVTEPDVIEPTAEPSVNKIPAWYSENRILEAMKEQNELLKLISAKLVYIVEQLS